jgi:hypothetical protein
VFLFRLLKPVAGVVKPPRGRRKLVFQFYDFVLDPVPVDRVSSYFLLFL